jgi:hypothetical protein
MAAKWSVEDVAAWVAAQPMAGAEEVAQAFREEEIHGEALLSYAELPRDSRLKADFQMTIGKADSLRKAICGPQPAARLGAEYTARGRSTIFQNPTV